MKWLRVHFAGCNLRPGIRQVIGPDTPQSLQGRDAALLFRSLSMQLRDQ